MRLLTILFALILSSHAAAEEYFLEIDKVCTTTGNELEFKCDKGDLKRVLIFNEGRMWYGKNPKSGSIWELATIKEDKYILVLDNPVFFSGTSVIHIMKATNRFYWSEFAYSGILEENEATIIYGKFIEVNK